MDQKTWEKAVSFHGHECPGLAIGCKVCEAAVQKLNIGASQDEEIVCVTENDACGVDAVQALLSCTFGKGNLLYRRTGKQAFSFFNRADGRKIRLCLKPMKNDGMSRKEKMDYILNAPVDELFTFSEPKFELPEAARRFATIQCEICGEGSPEHKTRLQNGKTVCMDCFQDYDRGW